MKLCNKLNDTNSLMCILWLFYTMGAQSNDECYLNGIVRKNISCKKATKYSPKKCTLLLPPWYHISFSDEKL